MLPILSLLLKKHIIEIHICGTFENFFVLDKFVLNFPKPKYICDSKNLSLNFVDHIWNLVRDR